MSFFTKDLIVYPHPNTGTFESLNVSPLNDSLVTPAPVLIITKPLDSNEDTSISTESLYALDGIRDNIQGQLDVLNSSLRNVSENYWRMYGSLESMIGGSFSSASFTAVSLNTASVSNLSVTNASLTSITSTLLFAANTSFVNVSLTNASMVNVDANNLNVNGQRAATEPWVSSNYVSFPSLSSSLSGYATASSLNSYVATSALNDYVTLETLSSSLSGYATTSSLNSYVTTSALNDYVTLETLSSSLASCITASTIVNYVSSNSNSNSGNSNNISMTNASFYNACMTNVSVINASITKLLLKGPITASYTSGALVSMSNLNIGYANASRVNYISTNITNLLGNITLVATPIPANGVYLFIFSCTIYNGANGTNNIYTCLSSNPTSPDGDYYETNYSVTSGTNLNITLQRVYTNVTNTQYTMYFYARSNTAFTGITLNYGMMTTIKLA